MITFGSLFAGIGGIDLGFERAGMVCKWQVEIEPYARQVLEKHWPNVHIHDDIQTFRNPPYVDIIAGGFPCQDISYAGNGAGLEGERSGLFYEAARIVREVGPRIVVLENVAALLTRGLDSVLGTLAAIGYDAEWHCIPAAAVGAPHIRDRVFIIASKVADTNDGGLAIGWRAENFSKAGHFSRGSESTGERSSGKKQAKKVFSHAARKRLQVRNEIGNGGPPIIGKQSRRELIRACSENRQKQWETEPGVGRVANGISNRVDRLKGLGNAVVPQVAEWIGRRIVKALA